MQLLPSYLHAWRVQSEGNQQLAGYTGVDYTQLRSNMHVIPAFHLRANHLLFQYFRALRHKATHSLSVCNSTACPVIVLKYTLLTFDGTVVYKIT